MNWSLKIKTKSKLKSFFKTKKSEFKRYKILFHKEKRINQDNEYNVVVVDGLEPLEESNKKQ